MVFTSVPAYLDWNQHQNHQSGSSITIENMQQQQLPSTPPPPIPSIRPINPQPDRGRIAKISQPETALKCPRCESTNTKFCYFNNYSLSQPRHFCKTCRRYWTRGGALRSVPVGGGCRRNKKTKSTSSRSSTTSENPKGSSITSSTSMVQSNSSFTSDAISHMHTQLPQLPFINSLHHLTEYHRNDLNLNFGAIHTPPVLSTSTTGNLGVQHMENSAGSGGQWRRHQFPILAGMDTQTGLYTFGEGVEFMGGDHELIRGKPSASVITQVKTEENQGLNIARTFSDIARNDQYWGSGNGWTDISGLTSSSTNLD